MAGEEGLHRYWSGQQLYGDDFPLEQVREWYADEQEAYAELGAKQIAHYRYAYHALNALHGFRYLPAGTFSRALGFGSALGHEFLPISRRIRRLTIVEPSGAFSQQQPAAGIPTEYIKPTPDGSLAFPPDTFDLVTCLGVLHHIPNVSHVVRELHRCLRPHGHALVREPVISLGDWRQPRTGLTRRERGIPLGIFRQLIQEAGFVVRQEHFCVFRGLSKSCEALGLRPYNSSLLTRLDHLCANLLRWNLRYHTTSLLGKFRPTSIYYVLSKP